MLYYSSNRTAASSLIDTTEAVGDTARLLRPSYTFIMNILPWRLTPTTGPEPFTPSPNPDAEGDLSWDAAVLVKALGCLGRLGCCG